MAPLDGWMIAHASVAQAKTEASADDLATISASWQYFLTWSRVVGDRLRTNALNEGMSPSMTTETVAKVSETARSKARLATYSI